MIELDGTAHDSEHAVTRDQARARYLQSLGLTIVRVENHHMLEDPEAVLAYIGEHFRGR